ncbi:hypothetical protein EDC01DRAFT_634752 [Geopyxis carbonaria]|nr:hypothetical protein EDC01DRAFT_634752 [Geopyxis carbonaria]
MGILKTKPLTELLSQSISPNVSSALLFTPSGSLLATGTSPHSGDAKKARTHAALAANIWSAYERVAAQGAVEQSLPESSSRQIAVDGVLQSSSLETSDNPGLKSLTLELSDYNLHIQLVALRVLLCLIGPKQPMRHASSSSSIHSQEDLRVSPPGSIPRSGGSGSGSTGASGGAGTPARNSLKTPSTLPGIGGSLGILKTKAQGLVTYLEKELQGFELPEGL